MPAGFAQRFVALLIDGLILGLACSVLWIAAALMAGVVASAGADDDMIGFLLGGALFVLIPLILLFQLLYFGYFWSKDGQSPGMKIMSIRVVKRDGTLQTMLSGGLRGTVGYFISSLIFDLGFIWAAFDANNEGWHDKIFDTRVERV